MAAETDERPTVREALALSQLFQDEVENVLTRRCVVLALENTSDALDSGVSDVVISLDREFFEHWDQVAMNLRHVKEVHCLLKVLQQHQVLSPVALQVLDVLHKGHQVL